MKWEGRYLEGTKGEEKAGRGRRRGYICEIGRRRSRGSSARLLIGWLSGVVIVQTCDSALGREPRGVVIRVWEERPTDVEICS